MTSDDQFFFDYDDKGYAVKSVMATFLDAADTPTSSSCVLYFGSKKLSGKRRKARRAGNGARKEIVGTLQNNKLLHANIGLLKFEIVVVGSPLEPMTRAIATDLERRGYIVYVTVSSSEEEHIVQSENRVDIRVLWLDITALSSSPSELHPSLNEIHSLITQPQWPVPGVPPHTCQLSGLVLVPSPNYVSGPVATIPPSAWADSINTRLLSPILTTQLLLPLLTLRNTNSTIVFIYPSISSSLSSPFTGPEVTVTRAMSGFATSLRRELCFLRYNNIDVVELKLGNVDLGLQYRSPQGHITGTEVLSWSAQQRSLYGSQYLSSIEQRPVASAGPSKIRGSPARTLHYAVLDALEPPSKDFLGRRTAKTPVLYVGRGARTYNIIGEWVPASLVGWMLGLRSGQAASVESASGSSSETGWERV
ncbi:hypothetical protein EYZ11_009490 [Aspergillus tanneri]|uniref:DUF1776-domain-containing protein n=1 Tax=Aspergillus tanneri TaxID=1220188 RepID=A0A4S3J7Z4_9EURO|nr:hypothetical protein EYZ11_009490 [Aspergillus tanneri]